MIITVNGPESSRIYRAQFNALMSDIFGFSFEPWHARGLWNADYTCYSIIENGIMLSNASVYRMEMLVEGHKRSYFQIGAVATRSDRRGEGLSRKILDFILAQSPDAVYFLFHNKTVLDFYPRFGFTQMHDCQPMIKRNLPAGPSRGGMRKLSITDSAVGDYLQKRAYYSAVLDCTNAAPIHWFHLLLEFPGCIYEIPDLRVMLVASQEGSVLTLYDVVAKRSITFDDLLPHLSFSGVDTIKFGFNPDWLKIDYQKADYPDSTIFVKGDFAPPRPFILPILIRT